MTIYPEPEINENGHKDDEDDDDADVTSLSPDQPCGWTAIRFITNNPGVWLIHCHLASHTAAGEEFVLYSHTKKNPWLKPE